MDDKRCPVCGMSVEGYQTKCECGFVFEGKTNEELKQMSKSAERNRTIGAVGGVFLFLASCFAKAAFKAGYGGVYFAVCAALLVVAGILYLAYRIITKNKNPR